MIVKREFLTGVALLLAGLTALAGCSPADTASSAEPELIEVVLARPAEVDRLPILSSLLEEPGTAFNGAVLVARGDEVLFRKAYGYASHEQGEPMALDTRFRIASLSKQFTAVAILVLQDRGQLSVDDPLCRFFDPCPEAWAPVRLHHLLAHTGGVVDLMARPDWGSMRRTYQTSEQLTEATARYRLAFEPGTRIGYSNAGYNLLGAVVEKVTGQPFHDWLKAELLEPLQMWNTGYDADTGEVAMGYALLGGRLTPQPISNASIVLASGALYSTLDDLYRWSWALHHGRILSPESYRMMVTAQNPVDLEGEIRRPPRGYGFGLFMADLGARVEPSFRAHQIYHTGSWAGFRVLATWQPEADVLAVVLSNHYHARDSVFLISQQALAEAMGQDVPTSVRPLR